MYRPAMRHREGSAAPQFAVALEHVAMPRTTASRDAIPFIDSVAENASRDSAVLGSVVRSPGALHRVYRSLCGSYRARPACSSHTLGRNELGHLAVRPKPLCRSGDPSFQVTWGRLGGDHGPYRPCLLPMICFSKNGLPPLSRFTPRRFPTDAGALGPRRDAR